MQSLVSNISRAQICFAQTSGIARHVLLSYNFTVACNICVQPTDEYIDFTKTVGVVWVCRRFEYNHSCRRFGVAVLTMHSVRVRSAPPDHRFDMKMLLLLTQICKCLDLSNQSGRIAWLKQPEYRDYICI